MSRPNVEILRAFLEGWSQEGPWTQEAWQRRSVIDMSVFDPDVVYEDTVLPDHVGEAYHGHEGVVRATERWIEGNEWLLVELEQILVVGERLISIHRVRSRARYTGLEFETQLAYLWTFRSGKVIRFQSYLDPAQAIEAAETAG